MRLRNWRLAATGVLGVESKMPSPALRVLRNGLGAHDGDEHQCAAGLAGISEGA